MITNAIKTSIKEKPAAPLIALLTPLGLSLWEEPIGNSIKKKGRKRALFPKSNALLAQLSIGTCFHPCGDLSTIATASGRERVLIGSRKAFPAIHRNDRDYAIRYSNRRYGLRC
jgi:hypothetical protein